MWRRLAGLVGVAGLVAALGMPLPAQAVLSDTAGPSLGMSVGTGMLAEPAGLALTRASCSTVAGDSVRVSWTASASSWADGYDVMRSATSSGPYLPIAHVGSGTLSYTNAALPFSTTFYYRVRATKANWTSATLSTATITTRSLLCL